MVAANVSNSTTTTATTTTSSAASPTTSGVLGTAGGASVADAAGAGQSSATQSPKQSNRDTRQSALGNDAAGDGKTAAPKSKQSRSPATQSTTAKSAAEAATSTAAAADNAAAQAPDFMTTLSHILANDTEVLSGAASAATSALPAVEKKSDSDTTKKAASDDAAQAAPIVADIAQLLGLPAGTPVATDRQAPLPGKTAATPQVLVQGQTQGQTQAQAQTQSQVHSATVQQVIGAIQKSATAATDAAALSQVIALGTDGTHADQHDSRTPTSAPQLGDPSHAAAVATAAIGAAASTVSQSDQTTQGQLAQRVGTPAWHDELGAKLSWMIDRGVQSGSLQLSPDHLGPLEVRISVHNDQVNVWFGAAHADTRAALENALPRLRDMLATQGMALVDAGVSGQTPRDSRQQATPELHGYTGRDDTSVGATGGVTTIAVRRGLLDAYA